MTKKYFLVNEHSGREFEIIDIDTETNIITLKGETSTFKETWDKERFKQMGYKRVSREVEDVDDA